MAGYSPVGDFPRTITAVAHLSPHKLTSEFFLITQILKCLDGFHLEKSGFFSLANALKDAQQPPQLACIRTDQRIIVSGPFSSVILVSGKLVQPQRSVRPAAMVKDVERGLRLKLPVMATSTTPRPKSSSSVNREGFAPNTSGDPAHAIG